MNARLEWPPHARITQEGRMQVEADHRRHLAREEQCRPSYHQPRAAPPAASASQIAALAKRVAKLENFAMEILPDTLGKIMADIHHTIDETQRPERIAEVVGEAVAGLYKGTWRASTKFPQGSLTTHAGSLWIALAGSTGIKPGSGGAAWKLVAKGHGK